MTSKSYVPLLFSLVIAENTELDFIIDFVRSVKTGYP